MKSKAEQRAFSARCSVVVAALLGSAGNVSAVDAVFSKSGALGNGNLDASVGLSTNKTYIGAFDLNAATAGSVSINGVVFTNVVGNNPSSNGYFTTAGWATGTSGGDTIGAGSGLDTLLNTFNYSTAGGPGQVETLTVSNLTAGQAYVLTFYSKSWGGAGGRVQNGISASGASFTNFDENIGGANNANLLRYTFVATGAVESATFDSIVNGSMHIYGF